MNWYENVDKALLDTYYLEMTLQEDTVLGDYTFYWIDRVLNYYPDDIPGVQ